jgi:hypothetical protein
MVRGNAAADLGAILRHIAALVGDIDKLKRERRSESVFVARATLASAYFHKRGLLDLETPRRKAA